MTQSKTKKLTTECLEAIRAELAEVEGQTCRFANVKCRKGESE